MEFSFLSATGVRLLPWESVLVLGPGAGDLLVEGTAKSSFRRTGGGFFLSLSLRSKKKKKKKLFPIFDRKEHGNAWV